MIGYTFKTVADILGAKILTESNPGAKITTLAFDTRTLVSPQSALFFAIRSKNNDGHKYLQDAYDKGVRNFVIEPDHHDIIFSPKANVNVIQVENAIDALQKLAAKHRDEFIIPIVGITGSNGKTVVK